MKIQKKNFTKIDTIKIKIIQINKEIVTNKILLMFKIFDNK